VILPREDSDGVGIDTVNVKKLHIEVWRVVDRNLVRVNISAPDATPEGQDPGDYGADSPNDEGSMIWKGDVDVKGEVSQHTTTVFPLSAVLHDMKPGAYVIKVMDASGGRDLASSDEGIQPAQARRWIVFTDMALTSYTGQDALDVIVRSLKSAQIMSGVQVVLMAKNGETLATVNTDSMGRATFPHRLLEGDGALAPKMIMAYGAQGDLALLDLDRSPTDLTQLGTNPAGSQSTGTVDLTGRTSNDGVDAYLYADRGIYRPGETVHLMSLVRDRAAKALPDRKGHLVLLRPSGLEYKHFDFGSTPSGAFGQDIVLPANAPRGRWTANLMIDGVHDPVGSVDFQVQDFAPQRLAVKADG
jgi:hypothetical protein